VKKRRIKMLRYPEEIVKSFLTKARTEYDLETIHILVNYIVKLKNENESLKKGLKTILEMEYTKDFYTSEKMREVAAYLIKE
jgi:hypothetical protein